MWVSVKTFSLFFESLHKLRIKITLRLHRTTFLPTSASPCRLKASWFLKIQLPEQEEGERPLWSEEPVWPPPHGFLLIKLYENRSSSSAFTYDIFFLWMVVWVCMCVSSRGRRREEGRWSEICAGLVTASPYGRLRCVLCYVSFSGKDQQQQRYNRRHAEKATGNAVCPMQLKRGTVCVCVC